MTKLAEQLPAYFNTFERRHSSALTRSYQFANLRVKLEFSGTDVFGLISKALAHLEVGPQGETITTPTEDEADFIVYVMDGKCWELPPLPPITQDSQEQHEENEQDLSQPVYYAETAQYKIAWQTNFVNGTERLCELQLLDSTKRLAVCWFGVLSPEAQTSPLRSLLSWVLLSSGQVIIHAAGVGTADGGVIFIGPGGSGKTTASLSCITSGLKFAGDDSVLIGNDGRIYSLYSSARISAEDVEHFANLRQAVVGSRDQVKLDLQLSQSFRGNLISSFPLKAIVAPRVSDGISALRKINPIEALRILAPSSILHLPGQSQEMLTALSDLVQTVPCYNYELGHRDAIGQDIKQLLAELQ